ncbi:flagellar assembly protein FliW [Desulfosporosinus sp. BICA1-9]|uniref:flagellar assembly protein FliW n=1 Tax=Desulfosporosinus sp. BICA1-9 TaxID=1531958 RepID=UPI00054B251D|nr:flagellar assembly protein FliW [Desulfosporosinus sp. BICA1-9]KJS50239.1 MAG: flagellar assembly protein FliW [Peptococcaceae bacterium BRH_c23]KJS86775.1 MAG: flagellar assembly protein FliW [Desulfosporosinus sp. BICA1-9]HBW36483.1 flagellar assembly protein FliW [Desulfosporosinus sp.]
MKIESTRLGQLEVAEEQLFNFPHGIPGFPDEKMFAYVLHDTESPFFFLQSTMEANLTFLLVDPFAFLKDYEFVLEDGVAKELDLSLENLPQVFLIANAKERLADMTVNLLAPIVINGVNRTGRQVILDKPEYSIRHKLFPDGLLKEAVEGGR